MADRLNAKRNAEHMRRRGARPFYLRPFALRKTDDEMAGHAMTEIDKRKVSAAFDRAARHYDTIASFQHKICDRLLELLPSTLSPSTILDGGCGTGYGAELLQQRWPPAKLIGCDLAPEMVRKTMDRGIAAICGDLEHLPFDDASFNLVWSNLALQWCEPSRAYADLNRVLTSNGMLACATLSTGTLHELDTAFSGIDSHRRVLNFRPVQEIKNFLNKAGFVDIRVVNETHVTRHTDFKSLLETIRGIGASQSGQNRRRSLMGKNAWRLAQSRYEAMRDKNGLLPVTYEVMFVFARKN
jgi:malonyl-CoA O-methyltransferase